MSSPESRKVAELVKDHRFGMLTTRDPFGTLMSRPMALQEVEFDGDLWFFAERGSRKVQHVTSSPQVNVAMSSNDSWVSLTGEAVVVDDVAKKRELWNGGVEAWLPQGPDDDSVVLIKVEGRSAEYWDTPGGRIATVLSFAKAKVTGQRYEGGENERVEL
ncbi:pyridoxamine 5'-phosphate oxidase family protein [Geodermatophilus sp. YIM 151500]|uniref:pyridoxamine 5'-phosphate oxidase family protein n=1 Tax=Geodermatophilus sp. YIM 151500 TaxID=2984531 RepID=UPI0021E4B97A|nr:pyridoxamine 5'-phosphate oxidase family protein [Geodermatophilus sp. YIM 151500]MCV2490110.1 pyridoxamine 5'-phosphate oxidase family protein [Geodermatophilus sp. YIM 151500]